MVFYYCVFLCAMMVTGTYVIMNTYPELWFLGAAFMYLVGWLSLHRYNS